MSDLVLRQPPGRPWGGPNMSPFCTKLETYLRVTETPHQVRPANFRKAPRGKIPYIELDGEILSDSQHIIEELERRAAKPLDAGLSDADRALGRMVRRTLEEGSYFLTVRMRWVEDDGWPVISAELKKLLPAAARMFLPLIRGKVKKMLHGQGSGRHSREQIFAMLAADWSAIAAILGDRPFLFGDQVRTVDCTVFAFLEGVLGFPNPTSAQAEIAGHANLIAYRQRFRDRWWKDLATSPATS